LRKPPGRESTGVLAGHDFVSVDRIVSLI